MRRGTRLALALVAALAAAAASRAEETSKEDKKPAAKRLKLGAYGNPYTTSPVEGLLDAPRFHTEIEVKAKAFDTAALTAKMEWWLQDFDLQSGATPRGSSAPSLAEMRNYRPHPPDSANIVPLIQWLTEKLGLGKDKK
jgi:hypothetical protein